MATTWFGIPIESNLIQFFNLLIGELRAVAASATCALPPYPTPQLPLGLRNITVAMSGLVRDQLIESFFPRSLPRLGSQLNPIPSNFSICSSVSFGFSLPLRRVRCLLTHLSSCPWLSGTLQWPCLALYAANSLNRSCQEVVFQETHRLGFQLNPSELRFVFQETHRLGSPDEVKRIKILDALIRQFSLLVCFALFVHVTGKNTLVAS